MAHVGIDTVAYAGITVSDLDRAIAFYRDVLGFPVSRKVRASGEMFDRMTGVPDGDHEVCFVRVPGLIIELLCHSKPEGRIRSTLRARDAGAIHIALKVKDIEQVAEAIRRGGFETLSPIQTLSDGALKGLRVVFARDPDGVMLELARRAAGHSAGRSGFRHRVEVSALACRVRCVREAALRPEVPVRARCSSGASSGAERA